MTSGTKCSSQHANRQERHVGVSVGVAAVHGYTDLLRWCRDDPANIYLSRAIYQIRDTCLIKRFLPAHHPSTIKLSRLTRMVSANMSGTASPWAEFDVEEAANDSYRCSFLICHAGRVSRRIAGHSTSREFNQSSIRRNEGRLAHVGATPRTAVLSEMASHILIRKGPRV